MSTENKKVLKKMKRIIEGSKVVLFATRLDKTPFSVCPMMFQQIDEQGNLWFFSSTDSNHFKDIKYDNRVQILYSDDNDQTHI